VSYSEILPAIEQPVRLSRFIPKYLDPASRLGEILFGLVMVLTVTLGAGFAVSDGKTGVRELLFAAIGCNLAWGIIDAVMFIINGVTVRADKARLVEAIQRAPNAEAALALVQDQIEPELQEFLDPEQVHVFRRSILDYILRARIKRKGVTKDDLYGALACFLLVFVVCLPAAVPFLIFSQPHLALRVSNILLIALLFLVGQKWAVYVGSNQLATGSAMVAIGLTLVTLAVLLGG
jgi:hypothetical protein